MGTWLETQLKSYGVTTEQFDLNTLHLPKPDLPPLILGRVDSTIETANTVLIYGHYDVQPVSNFSTLRSSSPFHGSLSVLTPFYRPTIQMIGLRRNPSS
jgi:acetylornithine deacetylase/succinyl-diaminopimelate desuccinylase-like protein